MCSWIVLLCQLKNMIMKNIFRIFHWNIVISLIVIIEYLKSSVFWDIMPYSPVKVNWHFGGTYCLHLWGRRVSKARNQHEASTMQSLACCLLHFGFVLALKMGLKCSSETSVDFHWTAWYYSPEVRILHSHCHDNLKSNK
jgi:hypothetical protein